MDMALRAATHSHFPFPKPYPDRNEVGQQQPSPDPAPVKVTQDCDFGPSYRCLLSGFPLTKLAQSHLQQAPLGGEELNTDAFRALINYLQKNF